MSNKNIFKGITSIICIMLAIGMLCTSFSVTAYAANSSDFYSVEEPNSNKDSDHAK